MSYAYLNNLGIWTYSNQNANYLDIVESAISNPNNEKYKESLLLMKSLNLYNAGSVSEAYITMNQLIFVYKGEGMYAFIIGLWSIEQGAYKLATEYLMQSITEGYHSAKVFYPIGLWLDNQPTLAKEYVAIMNASDTVDSRINIARKLLATDVEVTKSRLNTQFKNVISVSASNLLDEITVAESKNDSIAVHQLNTVIGTLNPFFSEGVLASIDYFNQESNHERAYEIIVNAMEVNLYSEDLVKAYIDQCFIMGFDSYAETGLLKLLDILSKEAYDNYEILFDLKKDQLEQEDLNW
jgi:tetratricopeptide (TPR) repeat protein